MLKHSFILFFLFLSGLAAGQTPSALESAKEKIELGQYQSGLIALSQLDSSAYSNAYFFKPTDPVFTYLIARSHDEAGNRERAVEYYKSYIELESDESSSYYEYSLDRLSEWREQDFFEGK